MVIVWSDRAKKNLGALIAYTRAHSPAGAKRVAARIEKRIAGLAHSPEQGSVLPNGSRRLEVGGTPYLVIFNIAQGEVRILAILHGRRSRRS